MDLLPILLSHGIVFKNTNHLPVMTRPVIISKKDAEMLLHIQPLMNKLRFMISNDIEFLKTTLKNNDPFINRLLEILKKQEIVFGLFRSDYLMDEQMPLQVEMNTISASLPSLTQRLFEIFRLSDNRIAACQSEQLFVEGIYNAWKLYNKSNALVCMVVQPNERNVCDQQGIIDGLLKKDVAVIKRTLAELANASLRDNAMCVDGQIVSVVYFRAGYTPNDYPTDQEWKARELIEESNAIKCPTVGLQLAGSKKVQQVLAISGMVEKYLSREESTLIRKVFAGLYPLKEGSIKQAIANPHKFVLKPQREGGGNNVYGEQIAETLKNMPKDNWDAYILMDKIESRSTPNTVLKEGVLTDVEAVPEIGVYGSLLASNSKILSNDTSGWLVRCKRKDSNETGIASGSGALAALIIE